MNADDFTAFLAGRLAAIVPAGFHVQARDGMLWYSADQGRFPGQQGDYRAGEAGTYDVDWRRGSLHAISRNTSARCSLKRNTSSKVL